MTIIVAIGVQKSVRFNNALNAVNFVIWIFIIIAGLFYVRAENWTNYSFAPHGATGIFSGAATCFYAFIGFDIIATTGEEAKNPARSIPVAIISTLVVCLLAYTSVSIILTLMVPYFDIHGDSALIDMFVQNGFGAAKYVVALGSVSALTVSLLGSMFPMPRVIYAMARDGLLFGFLAKISDRTGTPVLATVLTGICASFMSLTVGLKILVEMMSIGTLLAYTLVAVSITILRFQPDKHDLEPAIPMAHRLDVIEESPEGSEVDDVFGDQPIKSKREFKDDAQLIGPSSAELKLQQQQQEQKSYGSFGPFSSELVDSKLAMCKRHMKMLWWRLGFPGEESMPNEATAKTAIIFVGLLMVCEAGFSIVLVFAEDRLSEGEIWVVILLLLFLFGGLICLVIVMRQPQNKRKLQFMTPLVPVIPSLAMVFNMYLMLKLPGLTWARLGIWLLLGLVLYFSYSMMHSVKEKKQRDKQKAEEEAAEMRKKELEENDQFNSDQTEITQLPDVDQTSPLPSNGIAGIAAPPGAPNGFAGKPLATTGHPDNGKNPVEGIPSAERTMKNFNTGETMREESMMPQSRRMHEPTRPTRDSYGESFPSNHNENSASNPFRAQTTAQKPPPYESNYGNDRVSIEDDVTPRSPEVGQYGPRGGSRDSSNRSNRMRNLADERDPFVEDDRPRPSSRQTDPTIARPRPRPRPKPLNPHAANGNPFMANEGAW